jgi:hypothetical protein
VAGGAPPRPDDRADAAVVNGREAYDIPTAGGSVASPSADQPPLLGPQRLGRVRPQFRVRRPMLWVVLNGWVTDTKLAPAASRTPITRAKSSRLRLSRSTL